MTIIVWRDGIIASDSRTTKGVISGITKELFRINNMAVGFSGEVIEGLYTTDEQGNEVADMKKYKVEMQRDPYAPEEGTFEAVMEQGIEQGTAEIRQAQGRLSVQTVGHYFDKLGNFVDSEGEAVKRGFKPVLDNQNNVIKSARTVLREEFNKFNDLNPTKTEAMYNMLVTGAVKGDSEVGVPWKPGYQTRMGPDAIEDIKQQLNNSVRYPDIQNVAKSQDPDYSINTRDTVSVKKLVEMQRLLTDIENAPQKGIVSFQSIRKLAHEFHMPVRTDSERVYPDKKPEMKQYQQDLDDVNNELKKPDLSNAEKGSAKRRRRKIKKQISGITGYWHADEQATPGDFRVATEKADERIEKMEREQKRTLTPEESKKIQDEEHKIAKSRRTYETNANYAKEEIIKDVTEKLKVKIQVQVEGLKTDKGLTISQEIMEEAKIAADKNISDRERLGQTLSREDKKGIRDKFDQEGRQKAEQKIDNLVERIMDIGIGKISPKSPPSGPKGSGPKGSGPGPTYNIPDTEGELNRYSKANFDKFNEGEYSDVTGFKQNFTQEDFEHFKEFLVQNAAVVTASHKGGPGKFPGSVAGIIGSGGVVGNLLDRVMKSMGSDGSYDEMLGGDFDDTMKKYFDVDIRQRIPGYDKAHNKHNKAVSDPSKKSDEVFSSSGTTGEGPEKGPTRFERPPEPSQAQQNLEQQRNEGQDKIKQAEGKRSEAEKIREQIDDRPVPLNTRRREKAEKLEKEAEELESEGGRIVEESTRKLKRIDEEGVTPEKPLSGTQAQGAIEGMSELSKRMGEVLQGTSEEISDSFAELASDMSKSLGELVQSLDKHSQEFGKHLSEKDNKSTQDLVSLLNQTKSQADQAAEPGIDIGLSDQKLLLMRLRELTNTLRDTGRRNAADVVDKAQAAVRTRLDDESV
ncbi:hypothetical protein IID19_03780 [Patescibacteria group bacterium]|nr:hypothetical protein [Patescibacteria group bacterium]